MTPEIESIIQLERNRSEENSTELMHAAELNEMEGRAITLAKEIINNFDKLEWFQGFMPVSTKAALHKELIDASNMLARKLPSTAIIVRSPAT